MEKLFGLVNEFHKIPAYKVNFKMVKKNFKKLDIPK